MNNLNINFIDQAPDSGNLREDVLAGLANGYKKLSPKYFYDRRGSELFDAICNTPEYYPTRTEIGILQNNVQEMAAHLDDDVMLIELGSGASRKVRILLDELQAQHQQMVLQQLSQTNTTESSA